MSLSTTFENLQIKGALKNDAAQHEIILRLSLLADKLNQKAPNIFGKFFARKLEPPRGLYIWGDVGRGKTMVMDLFFASIENPKKLRVHFHAFMQDVHAKRATLTSNDVISDIAADLAARARVLCLDEMQVTDIADAMIMGRLFEALQKRGVCFVTTSNVPPDQLYKDGLNRHLFLPFISKLNSALDVVAIANGTDYRLGRLATRQTYLTPLGSKADAEMQAIWNDLTDHATGEAYDINLLGRKLYVPRAAHACARFTFGELCEQPLAAPDYLALARHFHTVLIEHVPLLKASQRNETKRFILMIDTFYDQKTHIVISAEAAASQLCMIGHYKTEFRRTASRLQEMQSASW